MSEFLPGATIGIMGGGQLGRMLAFAGHRMGYRIHIFTPEQDSPAGQVADRATVAEYSDRDAVLRFADEIDVLTFEFENIPVETVQWCADRVVVRPDGAILHIAQHRLREKMFLSKAGIPVAPFHAVSSEKDLAEALEKIGTPSILKTAGFGYDGKGQRFLSGDRTVADIWRERPGDELVLEQAIDFEREISVIVARTPRGDVATFPVGENTHANHILDITEVPAPISAEKEREAMALARKIATELSLEGLLAVEMFMARDGKLIVNELAPRPHNSGHWTIEGCATSQFEQQLRAICNLPLGATSLISPTAMVNLLGDLWKDGTPDWRSALQCPDVHLHLYGKNEPRVGRKMGHLTARALSARLATDAACAARSVLTREGR